MKTFVVLLAFATTTLSARNSQLRQENEKLFSLLEKTHGLNAEQLQKIRAIFAKARVMGQGNPIATKHPMTTEECRQKNQKLGTVFENETWQKICGHKYMSPLYDPESSSEASATTCIDQFEFPNIPCEYPVVWVRTNEAAEICHVMGKRLCDTHEWEGACDGQLKAADYRFDLVKASESASASLKKMRRAHNRIHAQNKTWSYGTHFKKGVCAQNSVKNEGCNGGNWQKCGSNTYPSGAFPKCTNKFKVYDIHGNAAEHMSIPLKTADMSSLGSRTYGQTEMKGSWFIWDKYYAHQDFCRWRAPYWHGTKVMSKDSHHNYHLGFRCCSGKAK